MKITTLIASMALAAFATVASAEQTYDFKTTMRLTKGKNSAVQKTAHTVNLGMDAKVNGNFWYMDPAITQNAAEPNYGDIAGFEKVVFYADGFQLSRGSLTAEYEALAPEQKLAIMVELGYNPATKKSTVYSYKSAGKWCATSKFTVVIDPTCYRVTGTETFTGYVVCDSCCGSPAWTVTDKAGNIVTEITPMLQTVFGNADAAKCTKAELFAVMGTFGDVEGYALAGQGTFDQKKGFVTSITGNIVGIACAPVCQSCCGFASDSVAYECDLGAEVDPAAGTAAYGTFSMKYNAKLSD